MFFRRHIHVDWWEKWETRTNMNRCPSGMSGENYSSTPTNEGISTLNYNCAHSTETHTTTFATNKRSTSWTDMAGIPRSHIITMGLTEIMESQDLDWPRNWNYGWLLFFIVFCDQNGIKCTFCPHVHKYYSGIYMLIEWYKLTARPRVFFYKVTAPDRRNKSNAHDGLSWRVYHPWDTTSTLEAQQ